LVQRYITPFKTPIMPADTDLTTLADDQISRDTVPYNNLSGLYLYNGTFTGVFSRLGPRPTISKDMGGITAATIWVDRTNAEDVQ
ncbi:MAG: carboxylate--amine ligase, partial [Raoultibacter sp.]